MRGRLDCKEEDWFRPHDGGGTGGVTGGLSMRLGDGIDSGYGGYNPVAGDTASTNGEI